MIYLTSIFFCLIAAAFNNNLCNCFVLLPSTPSETGASANSATRSLASSNLTTQPMSYHFFILFATKKAEEEQETSNTKSYDDTIQLLEVAIGSGDGSSTAATTLLSEIIKLRQEETQITNFLNHLLETGPDYKLPFWTRSKRLAKYSRRARMASLRRMINRSTPPPNNNESSSDNSNSNNTNNNLQQQQQRRRALVSVLRSLESLESTKKGDDPAIVRLEKKAIQATKNKNVDDFRSRLPEGLETPAYIVVDNLENGSGSGCVIEIRKYEPYSVCAVSMSKARPINATTDAKVQIPEMNGASSFGALAGYLFGKNDQSTAMKMTTPVFTTTSSTVTADTTKNENKQMEFVLPSQYWQKDGIVEAPQPLVGSGVNLQLKESEIRAVIMFGGYASAKEVKKRSRQLSKALLRSSNYNGKQKWKIVAEDDKPCLAQYNDPFTVPWNRLNEVSYRVVGNKTSQQ